MKKNSEKAVALEYKSSGDTAPRVVAKGEGHIARRIKDIALSNGIPLHRDDTLVELLAAIEIDHEIPSELYTAVAELLCMIYRANRELEREIV